ncbi:histidine kinase [Micromonospora sp. CPCC 206060]|uniref:histidine kinase n=1 Tax=Micromonospora sp. CPCC 206060 TaxID=3122406 RepID=UPI002FF0FC95
MSFPYRIGTSRSAPVPTARIAVSRPRSGPARRVVAWAVPVVSGVLSAAAMTCWFLVLPPMTTDQLYSLVDLMDGIIYGGVAWVVLSRRAHPAGWIAAAVAVGGSLAAFSRQWELLAAQHPPLWAPTVLTGAHRWVWVPGLYALMVLLPWLLPDRPLGWFSRTALAVGTAYLVVNQWLVLTFPAPYGLFPLDDPALRALHRALFPVVGPLLVPFGLVAAAGAAWRWRTGPVRQRHGMGWLTVGSVLLCVAFVMISPPDWAAFLPDRAAPLLMLASQAFFPAAVLAVVLRQQLWGIDLAVRRTLVWLLMTAGVIATYIGAVTLLDRMLPAGSFAPKIVVTALLAAAFQPVREWVQRRIDRLIHGDGTEPSMRHLAHRLRTAEKGERMIETVATAIATSLRLARVGIIVDTPDPSDQARPPTVFTSTAHVGGHAPDTGDDRPHGDGAHRHRDWDREPGPTSPAFTTIDLVSGQRRVGQLIAWPRPGERLDIRAVSALADLSPVVAAVVDLAATNEALSRSRARLAEARDEERRALRRDLHDGLGPALSGIGLGLAATRNLLHRDAAAAGELLDRLIVELTQRADEVRDLARDLLPPVLSDGELIPALHTLRDRYAVAGLDVRVQTPGQLDALPDNVATAVYGVVTEAVRNVHRHAGVDSCTVAVSNQPDRIQITIADHGGGPPTAAGGGVGLQSMRERATGVGGTLTIGPASTVGPPRGTTVTLTIPTRRRHE